MPARRTVPRRRPVERPEVPTYLLDPGGRVPSGRERLWPLLDHLDEIDPAHRWHDPLRLLSSSGEVLADVLAPAPEPLPDFLTPTEGDTPA